MRFKSLVNTGLFVTTMIATLVLGTNSSSAQNTFPSSGSVGIGTTSPNKKLEVVDASNPQLRLTNTGGSVYTDFQVVGTGQLVISPSGVDLTISKPISVAAMSDAFRFYYPNDDNKRWGIGTGAGGLFHIFQRGDSWAHEGTRFTINRAGNVGIGTTDPAEKLEVSGNLKLTGTGNITAAGTIEGFNVKARYQDLAEWVDSSQELAAGTVVVLDSDKSNHVIASTKSYDSRIAGVISLQPGLILGESGEGRVLVATTGRVKVKVDAGNGPIAIGDLLVTSDKEGIAMKSLPIAFGGASIHRPGTLIGKALEPLAKGTGEILVLLSLQ